MDKSVSTATCQICKRPDVPLDDSMKLVPHRLSPDLPLCSGSGCTPQAEGPSDPLNIHIITGPNGQCRCGEGGKTCSELLLEANAKGLFDLMTVKGGPNAQHTYVPDPETATKVDKMLLNLTPSRPEPTLTQFAEQFAKELQGGFQPLTPHCLGQVILSTLNHFKP